MIELLFRNSACAKDKAESGQKGIRGIIMVSVLHIMGELDGGVAALVYSYLSRLQESGIRFTILAYESDSEMARTMEQRFKNLGADVIYILPRYEGYLRHFKDYASILKNGQFTSVHCHFGMWSAPYLWIAKKMGIPQRIAHSHTSRDEYSARKTKIINSMKGILDASVTEKMACGNDAGVYLWKDAPFTVLPNAVDTARFQFDENSRAKIRRQLQIEDDEIVIGHIGRFCPQKNQEFFLKLLPALRKITPKTKIVLVGAGEDEQKIREAVQEEKLQDAILFAGSTSNPAAYLSAFDILVMPSRWEGLPVVSVEAQACGLPVLFSDQIASESAVVPERCRFVSLNAPAEQWASEIQALLAASKNQDRGDLGKKVGENGFDVVFNAGRLAKIYQKSSLQEGQSHQSSHGEEK